jgi:hypothetical protein
MNGYSTVGVLDHQPDLLACLQNVVRELNRPDIRTVSALIVKVIGDQNAGLMAVRLLHWFPRSKKVGGWVYKTWRNWNAECNLSQAQVKRVHGKGFLGVFTSRERIRIAKYRFLLGQGTSIGQRDQTDFSGESSRCASKQRALNMDWLL